MLRTDIIQKLIDVNGFTKYLEIGVRDPEDNFNKIKVETKHSVDPAFETHGNNYKYDYEMTSDEFFFELRNGDIKGLIHSYKWDLVFIDGLHISDQVYTDVQNSLNHLANDGYIVLHDCAPPTIYHAREDYNDQKTPAGANWNGTTWKAIQKLRQECVGSDGRLFNLFTVDTDFGVGVLRSGRWGSKFPPTYNRFYEYRAFEERKAEILNLVSIKEFEEYGDFLKTRR